MKSINLLLGCFCAGFSVIATAMTFQVSGDQLLMTGQVIDSDYARVKDVFLENPGIKTVILRKSFGGDAWTGYRIGEYFREKEVTTVVSGWCVSSCSRMFLGGRERLFSSDFGPEQTYVGFHGHYRNDGTLDRQSVWKMGLKNWTLKHAGPGLPETLVESWIELPRSTQTVNFYPRSVSNTFGATIFECPVHQRNPGTCKKIEGDAKSMGIITNDVSVASFDQATLLLSDRQRLRAVPASGYAELGDVSKVPLDVEAGIDNYRRFLQSSLPRAFAIAPTRRHWAWNSMGTEDEVLAALRRCQERAGQPCFLYAVDDVVVFQP